MTNGEIRNLAGMTTLENTLNFVPLKSATRVNMIWNSIEKYNHCANKAKDSAGKIKYIQCHMI